MPAGGIRRRERWSGAVSNRRPSAFQVDGRSAGRHVERSAEVCWCRWLGSRGGRRCCTNCYSLRSPAAGHTVRHD
jgi:hypothetical protein